jgi:hypothetical protein
MADESKALERINPKADLVRASGAEELLARIRREWQAKNLIERVRRIVPVDPSSACQRLLNAAIQDLRQKIVRAGLDVAKEAALLFKLPPVERGGKLLCPLENHIAPRDDVTSVRERCLHVRAARVGIYDPSARADAGTNLTCRVIATSSVRPSALAGSTQQKNRMAVAWARRQGRAPLNTRYGVRIAKSGSIRVTLRAAKYVAKQTITPSNAVVAA